MEAMITRESMAEMIAKVSRAINSAAAQQCPAMGHILMQVGDGEIALAATNGNITISTSAPAHIVGQEDRYSVLVPAGVFAKLISALPPGVLSIKHNGDKSIKLSSSGATAEFACLDAALFPRRNEVVNPVRIKLDGGVMHELLRKTVYAAAKEDIREIIKSVFFSFRHDELISAATNGRILCEARTAGDFPFWPDKKTWADLILPIATCNIITDTFSYDDDMTIVIAKDKDDRNFVIFEQGSTSVGSKIIDDKYPSYSKVIPEPSNIQARVSRWQLLASVTRASILSPSGESGYVVMEFSKGHLRITSQKSDTGIIDESINIAYDGDKVRILIAARYILPVLKSMDDDDVNIDVRSAHSPIVITGTVPFVAVLMPVREAV